MNAFLFLVKKNISVVKEKYSTLNSILIVPSGAKPKLLEVFIDKEMKLACSSFQ